MKDAKHQRKIIHIDCDAFFAAVEIRDNPKLVGLPIAVGGKAGSRGVLSTCSYEARKFGLHSAMATSEALRRCPQLILLPHRFEVYKEASRKINDIFISYTDVIEPLSIDEAFLDVSNVSLCQGSATLISQKVRQQIEKEVGITASAGIAPNKFLAKVASDWNKPNGQFVIKPEHVSAFMSDLPVQRIPGVGKATMVKMQELNIQRCADLQEIDLSILIKRFGSFGKRLKELSFGRDDRPVSNDRLRKSLSIERTFDHDIPTLNLSLQKLPDLYRELELRLKKFWSKVSTEKIISSKNLAIQSTGRFSGQPQIKKLQVKLKFYDFTSTTIECQATELNQLLFEHLLINAWARTGKAIRLLGLGVAFRYDDNDFHQLSLFDF